MLESVDWLLHAEIKTKMKRKPLVLFIEIWLPEIDIMTGKADQAKVKIGLHNLAISLGCATVAQADCIPNS